MFLDPPTRNTVAQRVHIIGAVLTVRSTFDAARARELTT